MSFVANTNKKLTVPIDSNFTTNKTISPDKRKRSMRNDAYADSSYSPDVHRRNSLSKDTSLGDKAIEDAKSLRL